jgi:hypothetical protein
MKFVNLSREIIDTYQRHGWKLKRVLLRRAIRAEISEQADALFAGAKLLDSEFDALWFARPSQARREAWELRLIAQQPYALFAAFEADESDEDREEERRELENKMRQYALKE